MSDEFAGALEFDMGNYDEAIEDAKFVLMPGEYNFAVSGHGEFTQSDKGNWYIRIYLTSVGNPDPQTNGRTVSHMFMMGPDFRGRLALFAEAIGHRWNEKITEAWFDELKDKEVRCVIKRGEYNGNPTAEISRFVLAAGDTESGNSTPSLPAI